MQTAVVTGASTGIGFATALKLANEGLRVFATVRTEASGADLVSAATGLDLELRVLDVDDDESVSAMFDALHAEIGAVDVLVNNAGISGGGPIEDTGVETFQRLMNTNAWGSLRCCKAVIGPMREQGSGFIANVTSVAGRLPAGGLAAYNMSKHAQEALTECLAQELTPLGIRVVAIEPGVVATPIFTKGTGLGPPSAPYRRLSERTTRRFIAQLENPATPESVADVIWESITTQEPKLRWPATADAVAVLEARRASTDEAWLAHETDPDDDSWAAWTSQVRGLDL